MSDEVLLEERDGVLVVTLNRPERRNAVNRAVADGIAAAMDRLDRDKGLRVGILTGAGGCFCSGMDLKAYLEGELPIVEGRGFGGLVERPPDKPLVAAVEGHAVAGGFELALSCDLIVAARDARFGLPEVKLGLVATGGGLLRLPRQMPQRRALEMVLTGDSIAAAEALTLGLINRVTPSGAALEGALALARSIAANGPLAVDASKRILREAPDWAGRDAFARQQAIAESVFASADACEGPAAFFDKRPPLWRGE